jgi:hypothetical protein
MNGEIVDTIMNVVIFVYLGVLLWLYFKKVDGED